MKSKGYRVIIVAVLLLSVLFAACAAPKASAPAVAPEKPVAEKPAAPVAEMTREQRLIEGAKKEGEVNLWLHTIADKEQLIKVFQARYPFLKLKVWDGNGLEIINKLSEEAKAGRTSADALILTSEIVQAHSLGLLGEYEFPNVVGWTSQPKHNFYRGYGGGTKVMAYNTNLVPAAEAPKTWDELKTSKWAGKAIASSSGEDNPFYWAYLWREGDKLNWDKSFSFWEDTFKVTRPMVTRGYTGPLERMAAGEFQLFLALTTTSLFRIQAKGAPIGIAPVGVAPGDTISIALIKNSPHPNSARLLIDWLTSEEGMLAYLNPTMYLVLDPKLENRFRPNALFKSLGIAWTPVPLEMITPESTKKSGDFWMKILGVRS